MSEYVIMPKSDYVDACDAIRAKTETTDTITSGQLKELIESISGFSEDVRYVTFMSYDGTIEYGKKAVAVGDDCADPIARGVFGTPTRESTTQYNYTFAGWATTVNGGLDANALKAVEEDRTVYANFAAVVRYYTITYYDSDGTTVLKTESLAYSSTPSYKPTKEGFVFDGWTTEVTTVTGNASYVATWSEKLTFADATWADIARISASGVASQHFAIGDTRKIPVSFLNNRTYEVEFMIVDFGKDTLADGSGNAGITIVSVPAIGLSNAIAGDSADLVCADSSKNHYFGTGKQYELTHIRTDVNTTLFEMLPVELQQQIKSVTKNSYLYNTGYVASTEKLWIPGVYELSGGNTSQPRYSYYNSNANRQKKGLYGSSNEVVALTTSAVNYLTRDGISSAKSFHSVIRNTGAVTTNGAYSADSTTNFYYAPVGFCI